MKWAVEVHEKGAVRVMPLEEVLERNLLAAMRGEFVAFMVVMVGETMEGAQATAKQLKKTRKEMKHETDARGEVVGAGGEGQKTAAADPGAEVAVG